MACQDHDCWERYGRLFQPPELVFRKIRQQQRKWHRPDQPAPGAQWQTLDPPNPDGALRDTVLEFFSKDSQYVVEIKECPDNCVCRYPDNAEPTFELEQQRREFTDVPVEFIKQTVVTSPDWNADPPRLIGPTGDPITFNPVVHTLALQAEPPAAEAYWLQTKWVAEVSFDITLNIWQLTGRCEEISYFVRNRRDQRLLKTKQR